MAKKKNSKDKEDMEAPATKYKAVEIASHLGIHPYHVLIIAEKIGETPNFLTTYEELKMLYEKYVKVD